MQPLISANYYYDPDILQQEQTNLFENQWNFAGLTSEVANHNDYLQVNLGSQSIIIHNFSGELKAFQNICTHRFCQIHSEGHGNRPLQCPYHGWTFDRSGVPVGIPDPGSFDCLDLETRNKFKLKNWLLDTCGSFIFIRKIDDGVSLQDYLGEYNSQILLFSKSIDSMIFSSKTIVDANWKVLLENALEGYHVNSVHSNTFGKFNIENPKFAYEKYHSCYQSSSTDIDKKWSRIKSLFVSRDIDKNIYCHQFIFPNLNFTFSQGISFSLQVIRPLNAAQTQVVNHVFITRSNQIPSPVEEEILDIFRKSTSNFYQQVFAEDKQICEKIQKGISSISTKDLDEYQGTLSDHEQRVHAFQKTYFEFMK
jgi:phenylpropionate dioxygenase-like ring-hydroxylating dioxygenase large terminal subunit